MQTEEWAGECRLILIQLVANRMRIVFPPNRRD
jgi:hypothetical protein